MCTSVGLCVKPVKIDQYTDLRSQLRSSYYQFFGSCWQVTEKFRVNLCFEISEHSVETTDDNNNVTLQAPVTTLVSYVFKLVSYFDSVVISNQIKYCLATSRGTFLQVQYGFYRYNLQIRHGLLLKDHLPRTQKSEAWHMTIWSIMLKDY